jgi:hypothetical protein
MTKIKFLATAAFALLAFALFAQPAQAQQPRYLHALSNLRMARAWLKAVQQPEFAERRHGAYDEINHAIDEIKKACRDDGKNDTWTPPPMGGGNLMEPYNSAYRLLGEARDDVAAGVDLPQSVGQQMKALKHIDMARDNVGEIIRKAHGQP